MAKETVVSPHGVISNSPPTKNAFLLCILKNVTWVSESEGICICKIFRVFSLHFPKYHLAMLFPRMACYASSLPPAGSARKFLLLFILLLLGIVQFSDICHFVGHKVISCWFNVHLIDSYCIYILVCFFKCIEIWLVYNICKLRCITYLRHFYIVKWPQ